MKILKYVLLLLLILFIGLSIYIAVQPNSYNFSRSRTIEAPITMLYNKVDDYKEWPSFSPWMEQDANAALTYSDKTAGKGARYSWNGKDLGEGSMTTLETEPHTLITQKIEFIKPFESESNINWFFEPTKDGTKVTWQMEGKQDFMTKLYTTFMGSIETNTAPDFERGLFKLDSVTRAEMKVFSINVEGTTEHSGGYYLYNTTSCKLDEVEQNINEMLPKVEAYAITNNITKAGAPFIIYHRWDEENNAAIFSSCIPTNSRIYSEDSDILTGQLEMFKAVKTTLNGDRSNIDEAWDQTMSFIATNNLEMVEGGAMLETFVMGPSREPNPAQWITEIYIAIK